MAMKKRDYSGRHRIRAGLCLLFPVLLAACPSESPPARQSGTDVVRLSVWAHAGQEPERKVTEDLIRRFNIRQNGIQARLTLLPEGSYNAQVQAAALARDLPDVLEFDGPFVYSYVWQGHLAALGEFLSEDTKQNLIPSVLAQATYRGKLYAIGMFDSGLGLYGRRSLLEQAGVRIPASPADAWTADEFEGVLKALARHDPDGAVLDLKLNYRGEWFTYAFSPALRSGGGDLIDRRTFGTARGILNGPEAVAVMGRFQDWIVRKKYVDPNVDDHAFTGGRVALSWVGHWEYDRYAAAFGDDLVLLPLPDFGKGSKTGQGSWNWGVTARCKHPEAAVRFIEFLLEDVPVLAMAGANSAIPATRSAIARSEKYQPDGPLRLFVTQLTGGYAVPRPRTPAYPAITSVFQQAFNDIRNGADVRTVLDRAAADIDRDIRDNDGYPPPRGRTG
ncbi:ABC transporter substrate-binding protein [Desulfonema ishimotonii]|uniref:ABC transporter substrate-binding protein n=1 Tax=Desulfonema ishimotonii TaxID=45657 RepID=A0A401FUY8_9BACT|nr:sugar ABC transporter substrate-binding protein [Desulfonema ishimotonii]GBC60797.1 ABC transporter substrate-binding protein [Desulfonema ishimotonii]